MSDTIILVITAILFIIGLVILVKGADLLVEGSASIAKRLKISSIVIGLTIVAFGTSTPELIVNIVASIQGSTEIAIGNILGSNIANILLILGISAMIYPLLANENTVVKEIPFSLLAIVILGVMVSDRVIDGGIFSGITRIDGIVLLGFFLIFLYYSFSIAKTFDSNQKNDDIKVYSYKRSVSFIVIGLVGLVVGGKWIVDAAVSFATLFGISESLIGLTVVAVGTSLPELATSAMAAYKKQPDIAIGNIVGSNIFNIFFILGISAIVRPLPFSPDSSMDIAMTIVASLVLFGVMYIGKKRIVERWQGAVMVAIYFAYLGFLISTK